MITSRGWWLVMAAVIFLVLGLGLASGVGDLFGLGIRPGVSSVRPIASLVLIGLTILVWFLGSLFVFLARLRFLHGQLSLVRQLFDEQGSVSSLWAGHSYRVRVQLWSGSLFATPYLRVADRIPYGARKHAGDEFIDGLVYPGTPLEIEYQLDCPAAGRIRFEGLQVECADLQGFFYHPHFVRAPEEYRVLPAIADIEGHIPAAKRNNILPTAGHHRLRRAGSSSELLDLRDYIPGDPPKTIAWKASARRDRLITKVFESEVPIRCTFFVDASHTVRVGPRGDNALARLVAMSAALAQASAGQRDWTGLCLFDQDGVRRYLRPTPGPRHVVQIIDTLADAASLAPATPRAPQDELLPLAYGFAEEVYPDLLNREVNHFPFWLPWLSWRRQAKLTKWDWREFGIRLAAVTVYLVAVFVSSRYLLVPLLGPVLGQVLSFVIGILGLIAAFRLWTWQPRHGLPTGRNPVRYRWRKKLAALLSVRYKLGPDGLSQLLYDDAAFAQHMQGFLAEHNVPFSPPLYSPQGEYLYQEPGKVAVLAQALLGAVARGKDNELFVLMVDLLESDDLGLLLRAVKVAVARHHQIILICPWPPEVPPPAAESKAAEPPAGLARFLAERLAKRDPRLLRTGDELRSFVAEHTAGRLQRAYHRMRRTFGRMGVSVQCAASSEAVELVLDRLRRMRRPMQGVQ